MIQSAEDCKSLDEIRRSIDNIDEQVVSLIAKRSKYVYAAAKFKSSEKSVRDSDRVEKVLSSKRDLAKAKGVSPELIENIYRLMIEHFINEELKEWKR